MAFGLPYTHPGSVHTDSPVWIVQNGMGLLGVTTTLKQMAALAKQAAGDQRIRALAERIVADAGAEDDYKAQAIAIHDWLSYHVKYLTQPLGFQQLKPPVDMLNDPIGVCTDISTLEAALLGAVGIDSRFMAVSFAPSDEFSHVFTEVKLGANTWVSSDATPIKDPNGHTVARLRFGEEAPGIARRKVRNVR